MKGLEVRVITRWLVAAAVVGASTVAQAGSLKVARALPPETVGFDAVEVTTVTGPLAEEVEAAVRASLAAERRPSGGLAVAGSMSPLRLQVDPGAPVKVSVTAAVAKGPAPVLTDDSFERETDGRTVTIPKFCVVRSVEVKVTATLRDAAGEVIDTASVKKTPADSTCYEGADAKTKASRLLGVPLSTDATKYRTELLNLAGSVCLDWLPRWSTAQIELVAEKSKDKTVRQAASAAQDALEAGDVASAYRQYTALPKSAVIEYQLGVLYEMCERPAEALASYERAAAAGPPTENVAEAIANAKARATRRVDELSKLRAFGMAPDAAACDPAGG